VLVAKQRKCIVCGGPLTIEDGRVCVACGLIACYGGNKPEIKVTQEEVWRRLLEYCKGVAGKCELENGGSQ